MKRLTLTFITSSLLIAASAHAQEPNGSKPPAAEKEFGNPGVLNIGAATSLNFAYESVSPPQGSSSSAIVFALQPQVQYFVTEGLSVGGTALVGLVKPSEGDSETTFGIGPAVGYNVWLTPVLLSLWPQVDVLFQSVGGTSTTTSGGTGGATTTTSTSFTTTRFTLGAWVPLLVHPVKHFHFGIGPYVDFDLSSKQSVGGNSTDADKITVIGLKGEIAGWL